MDTHALLASPIAVRVGWTLLHSLWQGALICLVATLVLNSLRRARANIRYLVACAAFLAIAIAPLLTFWALPAPAERPTISQPAAATGSPATPPQPPRVVAPPPPPPGAVTAPSAVAARAAAQDAAPQEASSGFSSKSLEPFLPYAAVTWFVGVLLLALYRLGGWVFLQRLRLGASLPIADDVFAALSRVATRLRLRRHVRLLATTRIDVPLVLGVLKPVILFPPALIAGLSTRQLEAILSHELAHVRRHDYLALLLQTAIETLLFYHPGTWWLSRRISLEREQCCDDIAAAATGDPREYATALAAVEELRLTLPVPTALAATGSGARQLMFRIARLLNIDLPTRPHRARSAAIALLAVLALALSMTLVARGQAQAAGTITIHVKEQVSGNPLASATVVIAGDNLNLNEQTNDAGDVVVNVGTSPREGLGIEVKGEGFTTARLSWTPTPAQPTLPARFEMSLEKSHAIGGTVVDDQGKPLPGAKVMVSATKKYFGSLQSIRRFDTVTADAQGRWEYANLPAQPDTVELAASHPACLGQYGFMSLTKYEDLPALHAKTAVLKLTRGTPVELAVKTPDGFPLAAARIEYGDSRAGSNMIPPFRTKDDGTLTLGIAPGDAVITVKADGYAPELQRLKVGKEPQTITIDLKTANSITGTVVDPDGVPVGGGRVFVDTWRDTRTLLHNIDVDTNGRWSWEGAPADEMFVDVLIPNWADLRHVRVKAGEANLITLKKPTIFHGTVVDAATGEPVKNYTVVDGISWNDRPQVSWRGGGPLRMKPASKPGDFDVIFSQTQYPAMIVRVESPGYQAADSPRILLDGKSSDFTFKLTRGTSVEGTLLAPDGKPLANATIYLAEASRQIQIDYGTRVLGAREYSQASTDAQGRFQLPPQKSDYRLLVVRDDGAVIVSKTDFEKTHTLTLVKWARVEGLVQSAGSPVTRAAVRTGITLLPADNLSGSSNYVYASSQTIADTAGKFTLERVFPGELTIMWDVPEGTEGYSKSITARPGETLSLTLGGTGHPVIGKIDKLAPELVAAKINFVQLSSVAVYRGWAQPVEVMEMSRDDAQAWMDKFVKTEEGRKAIAEVNAAGAALHHDFRTPLHADGTFRFDDIPAGRYWLHVEWSKALTGQGQYEAVARVDRDMVVPDSAAGASPSPIDVGTLAPLASGRLSPGNALPPFTLQTVDEKEVSLETYKGKYLVLLPWLTYSNNYLPSAEAKDLWTTFKGNPRFAMLGLSMESSPAFKYSQERHLEWPTAASLRAWSLTRWFSFDPARPISIIDPEGKVLATGLTPAQAKAELEKALAQ